MVSTGAFAALLLGCRLKFVTETDNKQWYDRSLAADHQAARTLSRDNILQ